jgi:dTDP-4-amino-4,6-dideoxygalactose transaminase
VESDHTGRWAYGLSKLAQERLLLQGLDPTSVAILRLANVFGHGQERIVSRWTRKALAGQPLSVTATTRSFVPLEELCRLLTADLPAGIYNVGAESVSLLSVAARIKELCDSNVEVRIEPPRGQDSCGMIELSQLAAAGYVIDPPWEHIERLVQQIRTDDGPVFDPPLPVVVAPRPNRPDEVVERQQAALWGGALKHGNRWSAELSDRLAESLELDSDHELILCASGTAALRLGIVAVAGPAEPRDVAVLPAFTFPATAEALRQLGYQLRFVDVEPSTWTVDPAAVERALAPGDVRVVVAVDAFGNPCDYRRLRAVCESADVPLVGDSAAALGSRYRGRPLAQEADAHAYSMSFAKVLSAGGAGGAVVLRREARARVLEDPAGWSRSELMDELHAIVALDQLAALEHLVERRNRIARIYRDALPILRTLVPQEERTGCRHSYVHWVARVTGAPDRDQLQRALLGRGVETKPYFRAVGFGLNGTKSDLPVTARLDAEVLALPMSSEMTEEQAEQVVFATYNCLSASR